MGTLIVLANVEPIPRAGWCLVYHVTSDVVTVRRRRAISNRRARTAKLWVIRAGGAATAT